MDGDLENLFNTYDCIHIFWSMQINLQFFISAGLQLLSFYQYTTDAHRLDNICHGDANRAKMIDESAESQEQIARFLKLS